MRPYMICCSSGVLNANIPPDIQRMRVAVENMNKYIEHVILFTFVAHRNRFRCRRRIYSLDVRYLLHFIKALQYCLNNDK